MQANHHFIHSALTSFADECCATLVRLTLNVGALALFAITGLHVWDQLQRDTAGDPADRPGFILASHSRPAFAVGLIDLSEKSGSYEIFPASGRRPQGRLPLGSAGRKAGGRA